MPLFKEHVTFFREFRRRFETTGAVAPSSRFLAKAMTRYLRRHPSDSGPKRILEIGPGTGACTRTIVKYVNEGDRFDLVELNESFADHLRRRFETEPDWKRVASQAEVHVTPIQEFTSDAPYDYVISGLPLNNFPTDLVADVFTHYFKHLAPGGVLSYFEYQFVRSIRTKVGAKSERERLKAIDQIMADQCAERRIRRDWTFLNIPPAWVQHLKSDVDQPQE